MTADEAGRDRQRQFDLEQAANAKRLEKHGAALLEKYGPQKYFAWQQATKEAGTR